MDPVISHPAAKELKHSDLDLTASAPMASNAQIKQAVDKLRAARLELALRVRCVDHLLGHLWSAEKRCSCTPEEIKAALADYVPDPAPHAGT